MSRRPPLPLLILLLSFPQFVETIYSPALPAIAQAFAVSAIRAEQTLSLWFTAFAVGVVSWGRLCDLWGRRPTLLLGLVLYALGAGWAMLASDFQQLLLARLLSAFAAAVGSIIAQTALRDSYGGAELARVFGVLGIALAISPALGMAAGQQIVALAGHPGVFATLALLALLLGIGAAWYWPETRPASAKVVAFAPLLRQMLSDRDIWRSALLIAAFNLAIFAYYQLGPFLFAGLAPGRRWLDFGHSGVVLALASVLGAIGNSALLHRGWSRQRLVGAGIALLTLGAGLVLATLHPPALLVGMAVIAAAYALAIPNLLADALQSYSGRLGSAGAILSLLYYNLLAAALLLAGLVQRLDWVLLAAAALAIAVYRLRPVSA